MAVNDMCAEIAALLNPMPHPSDQDDHSGGVAGEAIWREREDLAEALRASWDGEDADPLLATLDGLRQQRLRLESEIRLLIAYGRCFTHPRPYKLIDLATASGMSISGVRTAYDSDEVGQIGQILNRPPTRAAQPPAGDS